MSLFISYSHKDSSFVDTLALRLIERHIKVWKDGWKILVGDSLTTQINGGIHGASHFGIVLSRHALASEWVQKEMEAAMATEAVRNGLVILPLLLEDCEIPAALADRVGADFRSDFEAGLRQLMAVVGHRYNVDVAGRFRPGDGDSPYFTDYGFEERDLDGIRILQLDVVSVDTESQHSVLSQFEFTATSKDAIERLGLSAGESPRGVIVRTCADAFTAENFLLKLTPGEIQRRQFTLADADGHICFNVSMRIVWLGAVTRGAQVFDIGGIFEQVRLSREGMVEEG